MRPVAVALPAAALCCVAACNGDEGAVAGMTNQFSDRPSTQWHYGDPPAPSVDGAGLDLAGVPTRWRRDGDGFAVQVTYRNAPADAGLTVSLVPDVPLAELRHLNMSGGGLTPMPIPVQGDGSVEVRFDGVGYLAPTDAPRAFPVRPGRYIFIVQMLNHRRGVIGLVPRDPADRILAEERSRQMIVQDPD